MDVIKKHWHWFLAGGIFFCEAVILFALRKNIYVGVCDNLDLFIVQLKMLKDNGAFFAHNMVMNELGGIDRNYFPSEFSLYNILYFIFPDIYAYIIGYLLKLIISFASCILLSKLLQGGCYVKYNRIVVIIATAYALLPLYPMYALCYASIPLVVYLLIRIYREHKPWMYVALFAYPLVSYFSFFGAFILGYILIGAVILWIRDRKVPWSLFGGFIVLALGFVCFEYRLFAVMFSDTDTIRSTMVISGNGFGNFVSKFIEVFLYGISHAESRHLYIVLPICLIYFIWNNIGYITGRNKGKIYCDTFNLTVLFILFNCLVHALYYCCEPLRNLVETVIPPLTGFNYGRTIFFNVFAWYFAFFIALKKIYDKNKTVSCIVGLAAMAVIVMSQCGYSDFYNTLYCNVYKLVKHTQVNQLSYNEFYGGNLIKEIEEDIDYTPDQKACVYGFHPALLSYNGISTVDGYMGYYSEAYKETFRQAIEPTLDANPNWREYYDNWGCRAYLFSASGENTYDFGANYASEPQDILINEPVLRELGCDYIFSRFEITNADDMQLEFMKKYSDEEMPYSVYLYKLK
jgi:hypothetical protein